MKFEGWVKVLFPLILGVSVFILIFILLFSGISDICSGFSFFPATSNPPQPQYCTIVNPIMSGAVTFGLYFLSLFLTGIVVMIWEALAKIFRFKPASSIRLRWYFIAAPLTIVVLYVFLYIVEILNIA